MVSISLCMIVKNEQKVLARCLDSVRHAVDEIIIVDTGSTDQTKEIARRYTDRVYDFEWCDDFSKARNYAFSKASMDYMMWLDADDVLTEDNAGKLLALKKTLDKTVDMVTMSYILNADANGAPLFTSTRERLIRRGSGFYWQDPVHECIPLAGNIVRSDIAVTHKKKPGEKTSRRNRDIYAALEQSGHQFTPRQLYYYARELKDHQEYEKAVSYFQQFLHTKAGWVEDCISACHGMAFCHRMRNEPDAALGALLKSFEYDSPRAEICCELGYHYKRAGDLRRASRWFLVALNLEEYTGNGFFLRDCWGYIPCIELCLCHYQLGDRPLAERYNERALALKPNDPAALFNRDFFRRESRGN